MINTSSIKTFLVRKLNAVKLLVFLCAFVIGGLIFQKNEYYVFTNQLGYVEVDRQTFDKWYYDLETKGDCRIKKVFNLPIGIILAISVLIPIELLIEDPKTKEPRIISRPLTLADYSLFYFENGFNIVPIMGSEEGNNVMSDSFKTPCIEWTNYKFLRQTREFVESIDWKGKSGIGAVAGINNLVCIDIDECVDFKLAKKLLSSLGLPHTYEWLIQTGSGIGFHIWLKSKSHIPSSFIYFDEPVLKFHPISKFDNSYKQIEIRRFEHVVLPPSVNADGNSYKFLNKIPVNPPMEIEIMDLIRSVEKFGKFDL